MAESPSELHAEIEKLERKHAEHPEGRYFVPLANAYRKLGELDHAEGLLREGLRRHPDYLSAHIVLGRCLADRSATREAAEEFRYVLSLDPQNLIALRTLGELAAGEGRPTEAERWYEELLAVDPMNEDARRALEALRDVGPTPVLEEEFHPGGGWWQRPEEPAPEGPMDDELVLDPTVDGPLPDAAAPLQSSAPADEPVDRSLPALPAAELAPPVAELQPEPFAEEAPMENPDSGLALPDEPEPVPAAEARAEAAAVESEAEPVAAWQDGREEDAELDFQFGAGRGSAPDDADDLQALFADLALDPVDDDLPGFGADSGPEEVVTETIAELYARQGFHDRAADVYRELIRRRGGDPALERRLAELQATGTVSEAGPHGVAPAAEVPATAALEPLQVDVAPLDASGADDDPFASSFDDFVLDGGGEPGSGEPLVPAADEEPVAVPAPVAEPLGVDQPPVPAPPSGPSIAEYLRNLIAWTGSASVAQPPEQAPGEVADPEGAGQRENTRAEGRAADPAAPPAEGGWGEDLFPWEVQASPAPTQAGPQAAGATSDPDARPEAELFSFDAFFAEPADSSAAAEPQTPAPAPEAAPRTQDSQQTAVGEEDDLESFQAWLRSLKR